MLGQKVKVAGSQNAKGDQMVGLSYGIYQMPSLLFIAVLTVTVTYYCGYFKNA